MIKYKEFQDDRREGTIAKDEVVKWIVIQGVNVVSITEIQSCSTCPVVVTVWYKET